MFQSIATLSVSHKFAKKKSKKRPQNVVAMRAGKGPYSSRAGKHGGRCKKYFTSQKPVLAFQTLRLATLGKWATTHERVFFFGQELLLDFGAWIDLTSNADNTITVYQLPSKFQNTF